MVVCAGDTIEITPPQLHMSLEELLSAGKLAIRTVGEPGAHGAAIAGIQGIGVSTPKAAAVADATVGLAMDVHIANGGIFAIGLLSIIVAVKKLDVMVAVCEFTIRVPGAVPKVQAMLAVIATARAMLITPFEWSG